MMSCQVADEYIDAGAFYYPHNVDFRGRAYPLHPSLHHLGKGDSQPPGTHTHMQEH